MQDVRYFPCGAGYLQDIFLMLLYISLPHDGGYFLKDAGKLPYDAGYLLHVIGFFCIWVIEGQKLCHQINSLKNLDHSLKSKHWIVWIYKIMRLFIILNIVKWLEMSKFDFALNTIKVNM